MKPRVMSLVIFTCAVGLLTSPNQILLFDSLICIFFVTIGAGAAGTLNMWYESDLDSLMTRTCLRPIPTGKINKDHALIYGIVLSIISINPYDQLPFHRKLIDKKNSKVGIFDLGNHILIIGLILIVIFVSLNVE